MGKSTRIQDEPGVFFKAVRMKIIYDDTFMIGLHMMQAHRWKVMPKCCKKCVKRDCTINFRLPLAKEVEIRPIDDMDVLHQLATSDKNFSLTS